MAQNSVPEIDYTTKDFLSIQQQLIEYTQLNFSDRITNFNESSQTSMLIELVSLFGDILFFYFDRQANESYLPTATRRQSVIDLCQLIDYELRGPEPAKVAVQLTIDPLEGSFPGYPATIPSRFQVSNGEQGDDQIIYETDVPLVFLSPETVKEVDASEGTTVSETGPNKLGVSNGGPNQVFKLSKSSVHIPRDEQTFQQVFQVIVGGITWSRVDDFVDSQSTDEEYQLSVNELDEVFIKFGDGVLGKIPPTGVDIEAVYRQVNGTVNTVGGGVLTEIVSTAYPWVIASTNLLGASGADDRETIEEAKRNGPKALSALNRAVSENDHEVLAELVTGVGKAKVGDVDGLEITILIAPEGGGSPTISLINQVIQTFRDKRMIPSTIRVLPPFYQQVDIDYELHVNVNYKRADVKANVDIAISDLLAFDNVDFGTGLKLADVYENIRNDVDGVDTILIKKLTILPVFRAKANNTGTPIFSNIKVFPNVQRRAWLVTMTSVSDFSIKARETGYSTAIITDTLVDENISWLLEDGTSTGVALNTLTDTSKLWDTNQFQGQTLIDFAGTHFQIVSNTINELTVVGTPAAGAYKIVRRFVGKIVNPNSKGTNTFTVLQNNENSLKLSADISSFATAGDPYYIETTQAATGTLGVLYEDDEDSITFKIDNGLTAVVVGDAWTFNTSEFVGDITLDADVIPEEGIVTSKVFGGKV